MSRFLLHNSKQHPKHIKKLPLFQGKGKLNVVYVTTRTLGSYLIPSPPVARKPVKRNSEALSEKDWERRRAGADGGRAAGGAVAADPQWLESARGRAGCRGTGSPRTQMFHSEPRAFGAHSGSPGVSEGMGTENQAPRIFFNFQQKKKKCSKTRSTTSMGPRGACEGTWTQALAPAREPGLGSTGRTPQLNLHKREAASSPVTPQPRSSLPGAPEGQSS